MNLVDAIRMASQQRFQSQVEERLADPSPIPALPHGEELDSIQTVRFEVRLTTQQLHDLLQWLARNLHPVMTLREAARYLRLHTAELEALAQSGVIPAFKVDNKWRFLKTALDEWMLAQRAAEYEVQGGGDPMSRKKPRQARPSAKSAPVLAIDIGACSVKLCAGVPCRGAACGWSGSPKRPYPPTPCARARY
jgi:excisionase family DNA binding protein